MEMIDMFPAKEQKISFIEKFVGKLPQDLLEALKAYVQENFTNDLDACLMLDDVSSDASTV